MGTIVVGVDGSPESKNALRWAVAEARLRGGSVRAIHAYDQPVLTWEGYAWPEGAALTKEQVAALEEGLQSEAAEAQRRAEALVKDAVGELDDTGDIDVETVARRDSPAATLIEESKGADLLVVGSRGLGGFRELVLGSVSHQCAQHATCPVVILRADIAHEKT